MCPVHPKTQYVAAISIITTNNSLLYNAQKNQHKDLPYYSYRGCRLFSWVGFHIPMISVRALDGEISGVLPARRCGDICCHRIIMRLVRKSWAGVEGLRPQAGGAGAGVMCRAARLLLHSVSSQRLHLMMRKQPLRPEATCPRRRALLQWVRGQAERNGPGDHVASSCSRGLSRGPHTEQLKMLLPFFNRKAASPICWVLAEARAAWVGGGSPCFQALG